MCGRETAGGTFVHDDGMILVSGRSEVGLVDARRDLYLRGRRRPVRDRRDGAPRTARAAHCFLPKSTRPLILPQALQVFEFSNPLVSGAINSLVFGPCASASPQERPARGALTA